MTPPPSRAAVDDRLAPGAGRPSPARATPVRPAAVSSDRSGAASSDRDGTRAHRRAIGVLVLCTLLWATAGVGTRALDTVEGFEIAFWRALACVAAVAVAMLVRERAGWWRPFVAAGPVGLVSGAMWGMMFTAYMIAITRTTVANAMVVMAASPLLAALLGWLVLREPVRGRTWVAIAFAAAGIGWMVRDGLSAEGLEGMAIAFLVPVAAAVNIVLMKRTGARLDLMPAVGLGAAFCCLVTLPAAWPLAPTPNDLAITAALGVFQLALPCMLLVWASRWLAPHEIALLCLLEVVLGPLYAWALAGEHPGAASLQGGALVLAGLVLNELLGRRAGRTAAG